jgi:hypothetical protein
VLRTSGQKEGKIAHRASIAERDNPVDIIGRDAGGGWTQAQEDTYWRHTYPSSCGKLELQGISTFLIEHCQVPQQRILIIEACAITGGAWMEASKFPHMTVDVVSIDTKMQILTPDGLRKPTRCCDIRAV